MAPPGGSQGARRSATTARTSPRRPRDRNRRMDAFSYLSVLLSIILGLAITQILMGYRGLLLARGRVSFYAPAIIWSVLLLVIAAQNWWSSFGLAYHRDWTFLQFSVVLLQMALLYMMA